ncbi:hypothetical protein [Pseudodesulfovibrio sp.]|uniref:hypothetical protein n=1 Tax=Pseudodesulfovibrio sp. TaxID=2035812 RepID=UPI00261CFFF3|nr:hypothetical protein [Pseudodesulfovibrio sp.]MDD3313195.1 hypothetical protein [Pseudodesulfovibrio sp.]
MPGLERLQSIDHNIDSVSRKVQELRERRNGSLDAAMNVVDDNSGRAQAREAGLSLESLTSELSAQGLALHNLDRSRLVDLLSDPFEE